MVIDSQRRNQREADRRAYEQQQRREQASYHAQRERDIAEREARLVEQERLKAQAAQRIHDVGIERQSAETAIIQAIGVDAWEGYKALGGCNPERAYALAGAAATSSNRYHQLAALWLEAMTAVDSRNSGRAERAFQTLVQRDPEIDTVQQASLAADQAVLDMRSERADIGITCR